MIRKCTDNFSDALGEIQRGRATSLGVRYELTIDRDYVVLGMFIWETTLCFVVNGDHGRPVAVPAGLFAEDSGSLPSDWYFALGPGIRLSGPSLWERPLVAAWGYRELVEEQGHLDALLDGDDAACALFYRLLAGGSSDAPPASLF